MEYLLEYGLFFVKVLTLAIALVMTLAMITRLNARQKPGRRGELEVVALHEEIRRGRRCVRDAMVSRAERRVAHKRERKEDRERAKAGADQSGRRIFVLDFKGDMQASSVTALREEITAVLGQATPEDEVVVKVESSGGTVHGYGLAASQLDRIRRQGIPITVCVDKVAASGGYMMACVANRIIAAPFALIGSIGVLAQVPNFHRLLRKHDIDFEQITAGQYKRTLTVFGENTEQGREKFREDLDEIHSQFKDFIKSHRSEVDIEEVATGEVWLGRRALELRLIDQLMTSDEYLLSQFETSGIYAIKYREHKPLSARLGMAVESRVDSLVGKCWSQLQKVHWLR